MKWNNYPEIIPEINGMYFVLWAEPYYEEMTAKVQYWHNDRFSTSKVGANYIVAWHEIELPDISKEVRTKYVK